MITITMLGLDPYLLRQVSKNLTEKLADIYEVSEDEINFFAPEGLLVHNGVEQNTWNIIVKVDAPFKVKVLENKVVKLIHEYTKDLCVNSEIYFTYFSQDSRYEFFRDDSPRFMTEENSLYVDEEDDFNENDEECCDDDCCCHDHNCNHDGCSCNDEEEIYLGNAFEEFDKKMGNK